MKFVGSAKISTNMRISIIQDVAKELNVDVGDHILFYKDEKGNLIVLKG
jgi:hypothetical protein